MQRFLEDPSCALLVASGGGSAAVLANEMPPPPPAEGAPAPVVVYAKTRAAALTAGNLATLVTSATLQGGAPLEGLLAVVAHVYAPLLRRPDPSGLGDRLSTVLAQLQAGLASELRLGGATRAGGPGWDEADASAVQSPVDEFELWAALGARGDSRAREFADAFQPISRPWAQLASCASDEAVLDLLESTQDALDLAWKLTPPGGSPYPQPRMERLMDVCGAALTRFVHGRLAAVDLWATPFAELGKALAPALGICRCAAAARRLRGAPPSR